MAERLFDHHPAPLAVSFGREAGGAKRGDRGREETVGDGEIEEVIAGGAGRLVQFGQMLAQARVGPGIVEVALQIAHALGQPAPDGLVDLVDVKLAVMRDEFLHRSREAVAPLLGGLGGEIDADELKSVGKFAGHAPDCRAPARPGAWSGRRPRRKSPSRMAARVRRFQRAAHRRVPASSRLSMT